MKNLIVFLLLLVASNSFGQGRFAIRTIQKSDVVCNGASTGQITFTTSFGSGVINFSANAGASFQTSNTFTNLKAGDYVLRARDAAGQITRDTVVRIINLNPRIVINLSGRNLKCNSDTSGEAQVSVDGGKRPYSFLWSNGSLKQNQIGLAAGSYTLTVKDSSGCSVFDTVIINQPARLVVNVNGTNISCSSNGAVSANVTGGTSPYRFSWSNGSENQNQNGLGIGTYRVTVTDINSCVATGSVTLSQQDSSQATLGIGDTTSCGIIFFVDPNFDTSNRCSRRYLICAFNDQESSIRWHNGRYLTTEAKSDGLFKKANADKIIRVQGDSLYAAISCARFSRIDTTCSGWYLPSRQELKLMYTNLASKRIGGFATEGYWSSLETNKSKAWIVDFFDGREIKNDKSNKYHVRAIREVIIR